MRIAPHSWPASDLTGVVAWQAFSYYPPLCRVCEYALRHLHDTVTLADAAHFEETYFSSYFRKRVGIPFTSWLRLMRVARAVEILLRQYISIEELAHQVGFKSVRTFERSFRALTGTTPKAARKAMNPHTRVADSQTPARLAQLLAHISQMEVLCDLGLTDKIGSQEFVRNHEKG